VLPDFCKCFPFWKVPRLPPFFLLVRTQCRWRWVGNTGGVMVSEKHRSARRKSCPSAILFTTDLTWTELGSNSGFLSERPETNRLSLWRLPIGNRLVRTWRRTVDLRYYNSHDDRPELVACMYVRWAQVARPLYGLATGWTIRGSNQKKKFAHVQTDRGAHPASWTMGTGSFPGVKWSGHDAENKPPSSAEVTKG
jgi:hypothetical protein